MDVKIVDNSGKILDELKEKIPAVLNALGAESETNAKKLCPVDTGRLRNSITSKNKGKGTYTDDAGKKYDDATARGTIPENVVIIGTNVEYAQENELRTHFMQDGVANHVDELKELAKKLLK